MDSSSDRCRRWRPHSLRAGRQRAGALAGGVARPAAHPVARSRPAPRSSPPVKDRRSLDRCRHSWSPSSWPPRPPAIASSARWRSRTRSDRVAPRGAATSAQPGRAALAEALAGRSIRARVGEHASLWLLRPSRRESGWSRRFPDGRDGAVRPLRRIAAASALSRGEATLYQVTPAVLGRRRATQALPVRPGRVDAIVTSQPAASPRTYWPGR